MTMFDTDVGAIKFWIDALVDDCKEVEVKGKNCHSKYEPKPYGEYNQILDAKNRIIASYDFTSKVLFVNASDFKTNRKMLNHVMKFASEMGIEWSQGYM